MHALPANEPGGVARLISVCCAYSCQGNASSGLQQCIDELHALEETTRKHAKAAKKEGLPLFENGHWQEVLGRFVSALPLNDEVLVLVHGRLCMTTRRAEAPGSAACSSGLTLCLLLIAAVCCCGGHASAQEMLLRTKKFDFDSKDKKVRLRNYGCGMLVQRLERDSCCCFTHGPPVQRCADSGGQVLELLSRLLDFLLEKVDLVSRSYAFNRSEVRPCCWLACLG